jgi:hypothetical protein
VTSLALACLSGVLLLACGFWLGAAYGYASRQWEERMERLEAMSQGEYAEKLLRERARESRP